MSCVTESSELIVSMCDVPPNGAHFEIYWPHKELCKVQCLKACRFLQYILQLKIYIHKVSIYCHLRLCTCIPCFSSQGAGDKFKQVTHAHILQIIILIKYINSYYESKMYVKKNFNKHDKQYE
jgi:hypothetical protein